MTAPDYFDGQLFTALRAFVAAERGFLRVYV